MFRHIRPGMVQCRVLSIQKKFRINFSSAIKEHQFFSFYLQKTPQKTKQKKNPKNLTQTSTLLPSFE